MTGIRNRVTLTVASVFALAAIGVPTVAHADTKDPVDNGVRCAWHDVDTGEWDFYLPNETHGTGVKAYPGGEELVAVCGEDGK